MLTVSIQKHTPETPFQHKVNKPKGTKQNAHWAHSMTEAYRKEIVQRISRNLLDIQLLRLIEARPLIWGYMIKKTVETDFHIKLGHGALYPMLKALEQRGFLKSQRQSESGRTRKLYTLTTEGKEYLKSYYSILKDQLKT